jgi:hypothetical protein
MAANAAMFVFGKSPGAVKEGERFNMANGDDIKLHDKVIAPIMKKGEAFDLSSGRLLTFLSMFTKRAKEWGWNSPVLGILNIPEDANDVNSPTDSLLENYGQISMQRIRAFEQTYIHTPERTAQDTEMMSKCLLASLTEDALARLMLVEDEYHIGGELEEFKMYKQAQPKGKAFKGKTKDAKTRVPDPEWLAKNIKPSPIDKIAHHRGAPWHWCSPETGGKCAGCWRKHKPDECMGTARSTASVRSTSSAKTGAGDAKKVMDQDSDEENNMED